MTNDEGMAPTPSEPTREYTPERPAEPMSAAPDATPQATASETHNDAPTIPLAGADPAAGDTAGAAAGADNTAGDTADEMEQPLAGGVRVEIDLAEGDLRIVGGSAHVLLSGYGERTDDDVAQATHDTLRFSRVPDDAELRVPDGSQVFIHQVYGDLRVERVDGFVAGQRVHGDVELRYVAEAEFVQISGDLDAERGAELRVRSVQGDVEISSYNLPPLLGRVDGDVKVEHTPGLQVRDAVGGDVELDDCGEVTLIGPIGGDLRAEHTTVALHGSAIGGDVSVSRAHSVSLAAVGGDFTVEQAEGAVETHSVGGDVRVSEANGLVRLGTVGGDIHIENALRGVIVGHAGADVTLETPLGAGAEYNVHTSGDITLRVRGAINARFVAQTNGGEIRTHLPLTIERGRRRNLVGVVGRGDATVTLRSDGGDIRIAATDRFEKEFSDMSDENNMRGQTGDTGATGAGTANPADDAERAWEGTVGGQRFRVRWDRGPGRANFHFKGPFKDAGERDDGSRDFHFEWERGRGARVYGEYEQRLNELRDRAEQTARRAAEQAQYEAERATRRVRETDWDAVARDVRGAVERAMGDLEEGFTQLRREWEARRPSGAGDAPGGPSAPGGSSSANGGAQRVRIEYDDAPQASAYAGAQSAPSRDDVDGQRRAILEQLRAGAISLDEAERRLNDLR